jgi:hypothetical protein
VPVIWEAEEKQGTGFKTSLGDIARACLKKKKKSGRGKWHVYESVKRQRRAILCV